jgi:hypothetical protein
MMHF